ITLAQFNDFIKGVFDLWYSQDDPSIKIRDFTCILGMLFGGKSTTCSFSGDCLGNDLCVDIDGDIYLCDRYIGDSKYKLGNIVVDDFKKIENSPKLKNLIRLNQERKAHHNSCKWFSICKGGCPFYAFLKDQTFTADENTCSMANLISHIHKKANFELMKSGVIEN
ncbi:MAG: SPASM domain-containing protein, partial [Candidatus Bathyarchaeota archaeon]